jgi:hypothetical protein
MLSRTIVSAALSVVVSLFAAQAQADEATSRWVSVLPFGAGQFHRGDIGLGIFFAAGEALLGGTSLAAVGSMLTISEGSVLQDSERTARNAQMKTAGMVNRVAFAGWAALTAAGLVEAQVNLGRRGPAARDASPPIRLTAGPLPGGASVGLVLPF